MDVHFLEIRSAGVSRARPRAQWKKTKETSGRKFCLKLTQASYNKRAKILPELILS